MNPKVLVLLIAVPIFYLAGSLPGLLNHKPGMVITTTGDSVYCTLKGSPGNNVYYISAKDSAYKPVSINNIKQYTYTKTHITYRAIIIPGGITPRYLKLIDTGKIQLYAFYEHLGKSSYTHLFACKGTQPLIKIYGYNPGIDNEAVLRSITADYKSVSDYLDQHKSYTARVAQHAIELYNGTQVTGTSATNPQ